MSISPPSRLFIHWRTDNGLFGLALRLHLLTALTLGIYRFWAKTRIRQRIWSSIRIGEDRLEYTGTGLEKLLGFLIAVVVLAIYLGLTQLALAFIGLNAGFEPERRGNAVIYQLQNGLPLALTLLPVTYFARFRARRYMLGRTRWRGIRLGVDKAGTWGYVWRGCVGTVVTVLTLGLALPWQTWMLERHLTGHSHVGDARMHQAGRWQELYPAMTHLIAGVVAAAVGVAGSAQGSPVGGGIVTLAGMLWALIGLAIWRVRSFAYLTSHKRIGEARLAADPDVASVVGSYLLRALGTGLLSVVAFAVILAVTMKITFPLINGVGQVALIVPGLAYLLTLALGAAMWLSFVIQPFMAALAGSVSVLDPQALETIGQRPADAGADAEGFADALDIGAGI